jgi:GT2 family glycosyltransferase
MTPRASIVMTLYGGRAVTERCLASLERALGSGLGTEFELVLVDNASPDDTGVLLDSWEDRATVLRQPENRNFAGGNNDGANAARGDVLIFLNNDTEVPPGTLEALVEEAADTNVVAAGCRLLYPDGSIQHGGMAFIGTGRHGAVAPMHLFRHEAGDLPAACAVVDMDVVTAAAMAMRRELFLAVGGFDEQFVNGYEDTDLLLRARVETGGRVVYRGDVAAVHHEGLTRGVRAVDDGAVELATPNTEAANIKLFSERWHGMLDEDAETMAAVHGARFSPFGVLAHPGDAPSGAQFGVRGSLTGIGPESDEARALLDAARIAGLGAAGREAPAALVTPQLSEAEFLAIQAAHHRPLRLDAVMATVPVGVWQRVPGGPSSAVRLARVPVGGVGDAQAVWTATHALADELIASGSSPEHTAWLPPAVAAPLGGGGGGVLAILPAHELELTDRLLEALAGLELPLLRLLPTVGGAAIAARVSRKLPGVELLSPVRNERELAVLAGASDVVVAIDPIGDPYGRRALVAAAAGAAPVAEPGSAAGEVLGPRLHGDDGTDVATIRASIEAALADGGPREERAGAVAAVCAPEVVAKRLKELVDGLNAAAAPPRFDLQLLAPGRGPE